MKYTIKEFAKEIRKKYPNAYDDLSDEELVSLWIKKFPEEREKINFHEKNFEDTKLFKLIDGFSNLVIVTGVILFCIWGTLTFVDVKERKIDLISEFNNKVFGPETFPSKSQNTFQKEISSEYNDTQKSQISSEIIITQEARDILAESNIVKNFELDKDTENTLLEILSDPNPDPEMRQGEPCNNGTRCAYCNNIIDGEIYTYQNFLKEYNTQLLLIGEWASVGFGGSLIKEAMIRLCSEYKNGERYECKLHSVKDGANDFCSEKCKTEYSFSH